MGKQVEQNMEEREVKRHSDQDACSMCGNLCKTRCSRCKVARYWMCQIKHWASGHKYECIQKENIADQIIRPAHEAPKDKMIAVEARVSDIIKQEDYIKMLKSELQTERECVQRLTLELEETAQSAIIKVEEAKVAEMRKQQNCIRMLMGELSKMRINLQEEQKHKETQEIAMNKVREISQDLANTRDDLASAISRAEIAEEKLSDLERKLKLIDDKYVCAICLNSEKDMAFSCGHMTCRDCGSKMSLCPICRKRILSSIRLFHG